jgi:NAD(P)-dependent dehydrogenase (short-subunit alcohol dehydrogenase family)
MKTALIFGATGSIGSYIFKNLKEFHVFGTTSKLKNVSENIIDTDVTNMQSLLKLPNLDAIVWAQGTNYNDNILTFDEEKFTNIMNVNVLFIVKTLNFLLTHSKINDGAKLVIISSIWEDVSRNNKLSYSISKSALSGLVKNAAYDLSEKNITINNVLPGVIENEMTKKTLSSKEMNYIQTYTPFNRMTKVEDVFEIVKFLITGNTGITGQSIKVDLGFTNIRKYK